MTNDRETQREDAVLDARDMGCGELVVMLRIRLRQMPGQVLRLIARDEGAAEDIPAWCRMTGCRLEHHDPARHSFWIRSRDDW